MYSTVCSVTPLTPDSTAPGTYMYPLMSVFFLMSNNSVARDFVEAPSQMLENWCWEKVVLEKMSSHYETQKPLSPELIEKLIKSRYVNVGLFYLRQLFFANFDLKVHIDQGSSSPFPPSIPCVDLDSRA